MNDLLSSTLGAVGQVGDAIDKFTGGRALRGTLAGHPRELLSVLPFSDSAGITDERQKTSGRDLTDHYGITHRGDTSFGSHALGFLADNVLSPGNMLGAYGAFKAAPTLAKGVTQGAKALTGLDLIDHIGAGAKKLGGFASDASGAAKIPPLPINIDDFKTKAVASNAFRPRRYSADPARSQWYAGDRQARFAHRFGNSPGRTGIPEGIPPFGLHDKPSVSHFLGDESGSLKLPFDHLSEPPKGMLRTDPEWVNNRTWYHGTGTMGMSPASLDPLKTSQSNLFGRGIYTTDSPKIAGEYADARIPTATRQFAENLFDPRNTRTLVKEGAFPEELIDRVYHPSANSTGNSRPTDFRTLKNDLPAVMENFASGLIYSPTLGSSRHSMDDPLVRDLVDLYSKRFGAQPIPGREIYQAKSDFDNILDLDKPAEPWLRAMAGDVAKRSDEFHDPTRGYPSAQTMLGHLDAEGGKQNSDLIQRMMGDYGNLEYPVMKAHPDWNEWNVPPQVRAIQGSMLPQEFKSMGYDAFTHTGGLRMGGGKNLHQVTIGLDPNDVLGTGRKTPYSAWEPFRDFLGDESGYLKSQIPGVPEHIANAMDGLGPQYPGGVQKLRDIAEATASRPPEDVTRFGINGTPLDAGMSSGEDPKDLARMLGPYGRISRMADNTAHAERLASEIPEGSSFLGRGASSVAFKAPDGRVVLVRDSDSPAFSINRPDLPHVLQPVRETQVGPYKVEHLPYVDKLDGWDAHLASKHLYGDLREQGYSPWDVGNTNVGRTAEGKGIVFDGNAVMPGKAGNFRFGQRPVFDAPQGDLLQQALTAGGPDQVRAAIQRGLSIGTQGQGINVPGMGLPIPELSSGGPGLGTLLGVLGGTGVTAGLAAYLMNTQG